MNKCKICNKKISKYSELGYCIICSNKFAHKRGKTEYYCKKCNKKISYNPKIQGSGLCKSCSHQGNRNPMYNKKRPDLAKRNKENRIYPKKYCPVCNKKIAYYNNYCKKHIYNTFKGTKRPKHSKRMTGINNPAYIDGNSKFPYPMGFNKKLKEFIKKRDNYICQKCGKKGNTVHHIDYTPLNIKKHNLITLCDKCNKQVNFNRDYWFAYFTYIMENNYEG